MPAGLTLACLMAALRWRRQATVRRRQCRTTEVVVLAEQFDLVVIGGGPGGYGAAFYAASAGLNVADRREGRRWAARASTVGCIPAKAFLETAAVHRHVAPRRRVRHRAQRRADGQLRRRPRRASRSSSTAWSRASAG